MDSTPVITSTNSYTKQRQLGFYFTLGRLYDAEEDACPEYDLLKSCELRIVREFRELARVYRRKVEHDTEVDAFELCELEPELTELNGEVEFSIYVEFFGEPSKGEAFKIRDFLLGVLSEAGREAGKEVRFTRLKGYRVLEVTQWTDESALLEGVDTNAEAG